MLAIIWVLNSWTHEHTMSLWFPTNRLASYMVTSIEFQNKISYSQSFLYIIFSSFFNKIMRSLCFFFSLIFDLYFIQPHNIKIFWGRVEESPQNSLQLGPLHVADSYYNVITSTLCVLFVAPEFSGGHLKGGHDPKIL